MHIKKTGLSIFILFITLFVSKSAIAQHGWRIGLETGVLQSRTFFTDTVNDSYKRKFYTGYRVGATLYYGRSEFNGFSLGFQFVDKGFKYQYKTGDSLNTLAQVKSGNKFLEIPFCMLFKQDLGISGFVRESFGIGGAFQLNKYDSSKTDSKTGIFSAYNSREKAFNPFFRLGIEVGNRFDNGDLITLGFHYQQGFGTVSRQQFFNPTNNRTYFNTRLNGSYFALNLGYHFNLSNIGSKEEFFTKISPVSISY